MSPRLGRFPACVYRWPTSTYHSLDRCRRKSVLNCVAVPVYGLTNESTITYRLVGGLKSGIPPPEPAPKKGPPNWEAVNCGSLFPMTPRTHTSENLLP